ncbi:MAG: Ig-like domain-containing protein, partial [Maritimibacter sp.]
VNDEPVAVDDATSTPEDTEVTYNVLPNDSDVDGDPLTVTEAVLTSGEGTVSFDPNGDVTFDPADDFTGVATITYTITDGNGGTDTAVLTIDVPRENDAPEAEDDTATTPEGTPVVIDVLAND